MGHAARRVRRILLGTFLASQGLLLHHWGNGLRAQHQSLHVVSKLGGKVMYQPHPLSALLPANASAWRQAIDRPVFIDLSFTELSDQHLVQLHTCRGVEQLLANSTALTDEAFRWLPAGRLENLEIGSTKITDHGLAHLATCPHLRRLGLSGLNVGPGLKHLRSCPRLGYLNLWSSAVRNVDLRHLEPLTQLHDLNLGYTAVTDEGLPHLRGLTELKRLNLRRCRISETGLRHLIDLPALRWVNLMECDLPPEAIAQFIAARRSRGWTTEIALEMAPVAPPMSARPLVVAATPLPRRVLADAVRLRR